MDNMPQNIEALEQELKTLPESAWIERGEQAVIRLFAEAAKDIPAYQSFLSTQKVDHALIDHVDALSRVPTLSKDNYLRKYTRAELTPGGNFARVPWIVSATSGSTGKQYYFPRTTSQNYQYAEDAALYLREHFRVHERTTLYVNCFGMGVWIGGLFTHDAVRLVAETYDYPISIISPGVGKVAAIDALRELAHEFDQVIIAGYPPLVKDLIDEGTATGLDWAGMHLGIIFSAEGFSEQYRAHIYNRAGITDYYRGSLNHYGTVDLGTMSHETPVCLLIRKLAAEDAILATALWGDPYKQPTLTQYRPDKFYFEVEDDRLICSADAGLPLVRYDLKDRGGIMTLARMRDVLRSHGYDLDEELVRAGIADSLWQLPFVYVYERLDFSVPLYGVNIYPETVRGVLAQPTFRDHYTGRCTLEIGYDDNQDQYLLVHVETETIDEPDTDKLVDALITALQTESSEYKELEANVGKRAVPRVQVWSRGDKTHFSGQGKQRWVKK